MQYSDRERLQAILGLVQGWLVGAIGIYHFKIIAMLDLENRLKTYIPALFDFLQDETISWSKVNQQFNKEFERKRQLYLDNDNYLLCEASFYDIISQSINDNKSALRLFTFFNNLLQELNTRVPKSLIRKLKKTVYNLLTNFDKNYLNFIGELAILNNLLKTEIYILEDIEYPLGNGNFLDFKLYNKEIEKSIYIEVVNIHPKKEISSNYDDINLFLSKRINDKVLLTKKELNTTIDFTLTPVIWAPHADLYKLYLFFKEGNHLKIDSAIEPSAYICFYEEESNYLLQKFGRLSTLFNS